MATPEGITTLELVWMTTQHEYKQVLKPVKRSKMHKVVG